MILPRQIKHHPIGIVPVHIIYRLFGSIPRIVTERLITEREELFNNSNQDPHPTDKNQSSGLLNEVLKDASEAFESKLDEALHYESNGPYYLADPKVGQEIIKSWMWIAKKFDLYIYVICVMSNHVHILLRSQDENKSIDPATIMQPHKSFTAKACNKILGRKGVSFWESNYFDRTLRPNTFTRVVWYILNNPVEAGLVDDWRKWTNTWLNPDLDAAFRNG